jgi:hypothetical protein
VADKNNQELCPENLECLPIRILAKCLGIIIPDNEGLFIHLDNKKFAVTIFDGQVHIEIANDCSYNDGDKLLVMKDDKIIN